MRRTLFVTSSVLALAAIGVWAADDKKVIEPIRIKPAAKTITPPATSNGAASNQPDETVEVRPSAVPTERTNATGLASTEHSEDEAAIRRTGDTFMKAYADADADAIAAHFTPDAEYIDEQGNVHQGRAAITVAMNACFAEKMKCQIEMNIDSIRFISAGVAVEDGTTTVMPSDGTEPIYGKYTAVHVKTAGKWLAASVRDHALKERRQHRSQLQQLGWLQGDWVDENDECVVTFSCSSADNGNFLLRKFAIQVAGQEAMSGTQRIGWDPMTGKLRAWIFDSEGGYSDGSWHRDGDRWVLKTTGVTADGQTASSTSIYTFINDQTITWQSVDHEIAGVQLADSELVTIVRRAPSPEQDEQPVSLLK